MNRTLTVLILSGVVLSGCATVRDSRVNPFNWFGSSTPAPVNVDPEATGAANPLIPQRRASIIWGREREYAGRPVANIDELLIERRPGGAGPRRARAARRGSARSRGRSTILVLDQRRVAVVRFDGGVGRAGPGLIHHPAHISRRASAMTGWTSAAL